MGPRQHAQVNAAFVAAMNKRASEADPCDNHALVVQLSRIIGTVESCGGMIGYAARCADAANILATMAISVIVEGRKSNE
jgi:hypothetical protein